MTFRALTKAKLAHGVSDASWGSMRKGAGNAQAFLASLGAETPSEDLVWAEQVFGAGVHIVQQKDSGVIPGVDGLLSNIPGKAIAVVSADCVPLLLFDPKQKAAAVLHGSRKSLVEGIIPNTLKAMAREFQTDPKEVLVGIGPHIRVCHYWLKPNTLEKLKGTVFKKYFVRKNGKVYFDLTKLARTQLQEGGVPDNNIEDRGACTFCGPGQYFSAREHEEGSPASEEPLPVFLSFIKL